MQKQMLAKRNPEMFLYVNDFKDYKSQSKQWKIDVKNDVKTGKEYIEWLNSKKRTVNNNG
jgi:hypothetical protein